MAESRFAANRTTAKLRSATSGSSPWLKSGEDLRTKGYAGSTERIAPGKFPFAAPASIMRSGNKAPAYVDAPLFHNGNPRTPIERSYYEGYWRVPVAPIAFIVAALDRGAKGDLPHSAAARPQ